MKTIIIIMTVLWGFAGPASAFEVHSSVLNKSGMFTLARSVKLGTLTDDAQGFTGKNIPAAQKEKYDCSRDDNCASNQKCLNSKCVDACTANPCASGKQCIAQAGHTRACVECTSDSQCAAGKRCSNGSCVNIPGWCGADSACSSSQKCVNNACTALTCGICETASEHACVKKSGCCTSAADCGTGYKCTANRCVESGEPCYGGTCHAGTYCDGVAKQCCDNSQKGKQKSPGKCSLETIRGDDNCEPSQFINGRWVEGKCR